MNAPEKAEQILSYYAFLQADQEWSRLLKEEFGKQAGDVRYTVKGKGIEGSALRTAHDAFQAASERWRRAMYSNSSNH